MARKRNFRIEHPHGTVVQVKHRDGTVSCKLKWNEGFSRKYKKDFESKQEFVDSECIRRMTNEEIHPRLSGILAKSATLGTAIGSGEINQIAPYARRQYYEHKEKSYWFERMKNRHKDSILKGAQKIG